MEDHYRFESFGERHLKLRETFCCGEESLDRYLRKQARKEMEQRLAAVRVLYDSAENRIAGYYTLSAVSIERDVLPSNLTRRVAKYQVYPATLIGRLAIDREYRGRRLGGRILLDALARALTASQEVASFAVVTDAKDETAQSFHEHYGFQPLPTKQHGRRLFLSMGTIERLFAEAPDEGGRGST